MLIELQGTGPDLVISAADDRVHMPSGQIQPRMVVTAPIRGESALPRGDGRTTTRWTIVVTKQHANRAAALGYMRGLPDLVRARAAQRVEQTLSFNDQEYAYSHAAIEEVRWEDRGLTTITTWQIVTAAAQI